MPKRDRFLLAALVLLGALAGCGSSPLGPTGRYDFKNYGFSIRFPKNWEIREGYSIGSTVTVAVTALSPPDSSTDRFRDRIIVITETLSSKTRVEDYSVQFALSQMTKFPEYSDYLPMNWWVETISSSQYTAVVNYYRYFPKDFRPIKTVDSSGQTFVEIRDFFGLAHFLMNDLKTYVVIHYGESNKFYKNTELFKDVIGSFRFEQSSSLGGVR
jgi:hypothetical protein